MSSISCVLSLAVVAVAVAAPTAADMNSRATLQVQEDGSPPALEEPGDDGAPDGLPASSSQEVLDSWDAIGLPDDRTLPMYEEDGNADGSSCSSTSNCPLGQ